MNRRAAAVLAVLAAVLALPAAAPAAEVTKTFRVGPIAVSGYEVKQNEIEVVPSPQVDGHITKMDVDVVDADGTRVPISRLMLHHIVFSNLGRKFGERRDATCGQFLGLDSKTTFPAVAERFYAAGEERAVMQLPPKHGYPIRKGDRWLMTWMLMNHRRERDEAYIQYNVTYDTSPGMTDVTPWWLDVANCKADPIYDVPGGGKRGSTHTRSSTWKAPASGRIVAAGGHVHGGAKGLEISQPACADRSAFTSKPAWGTSKHPFYNVKPILHEPGPINMSGFNSAEGIPVRAGEPLKLSAHYDAQRPHTRVMGIMLAYFARDDSVKPCAPIGKLDVLRTQLPHRTRPPRFRVPLTGLDDDGRAVTIKRPEGASRRYGKRATIRVRDSYFKVPNVSIRRGGTVKWVFDSKLLHNVTIADGPRGFSSEHLDGGRTFKKKLKVAGTYKLFCGLHPVQMTQVIKVRR